MENTYLNTTIVSTFCRFCEFIRSRGWQWLISEWHQVKQEMICIYIYIWLCNNRVSWASRSQRRYPGLESRLRHESFCFSFYLSRYCRHIICLTLSVIIIKLKLSLIWNEIRRRMTQKRLCGKCSLQQRVNSRHIYMCTLVR